HTLLRPAAHERRVPRPRWPHATRVPGLATPGGRRVDGQRRPRRGLTFLQDAGSRSRLGVGTMDTQIPPPVVLYQLASAHYVSRALYVAAELDIADLLADGPQSSETLAAKTDTHAPSLRRVLRLLVTAGVFAEDADGRFELTPVGMAL